MGKYWSKRWMSAAAGLALLASACGGSGESNSEPPIGSEEFGLTMEQLTQKVEEVEGLIGECMRAAGFEYVPVDFGTVRKAMLADKTAPGLSDEEFVAQYGYGYSTQFDKPSIQIGRGEENLRIYEGLPAGDKVAYDLTLFGENTSAAFAVALEDENFSETGGCTRSAVEEAFDADALAGSYVNPGDLQIEQDPRVIAATEEWSDCVGLNGYDYSHPDDIRDDIVERFNAITQDQDPRTLTGSALDALTQLQGEERAIAQVDVTCEEEYLEPVIEEVETEIYGAPQG